MRTASLVTVAYFSRIFFLYTIFFNNAPVCAKSFYLNVYPVISIDKQVDIVNIKQVAKLTHENSLSENDVASINAIKFKLPLINSESRQYLTGAKIKDAVIFALSEEDRAQVVISAPPRVVVRIKTDVDVSSGVVDSAKKQLQNYLDEHYQKGKISLIAMPDIHHEGEVKYVPREIAAPIKKRTAVWVDVFAAEGLIQSVPVWFEVKAHVQVFVLKLAVARGDAVNRKHFLVRSKNINDISSEAVLVGELGDEQFVDFVYGDNISKKEILDRRFIQKTAAINFGDEVKVISTVGSVSITTNAIAQGKADIGQKIKLMTAEGKEVYWGKVVARKQAVVEAYP